MAGDESKMKIIDRLRELEAKATPGPWASIKKFGNGYVETKIHGNPIAELYASPAEANADLIAEMRNALPKLLAVLNLAETWAFCSDLIYRENWTPQSCGECSGCKMMKALDALDEEP